MTGTDQPDRTRGPSDGTNPPRWYSPALGGIWALLLASAMAPFPANAAIATISAAMGGYLVGKVEGGFGSRKAEKASRHGAPLLVFLLGLLGLSLFAYQVVDIGWAPPALALVAFGTAWASGASGHA